MGLVIFLAVLVTAVIMGIYVGRKSISKIV